MQYAAVMLCPGGGVIRDEETQEVANVLVGDFESYELAIEQACCTLDCTHLHKGVISRGANKGGFLVISTQEMEAV